MNDVLSPIVGDWDYYSEITPMGSGTIYVLSYDKEDNVVLVDQEGKPFPKPEKKIGFV